MTTIRGYFFRALAVSLLVLGLNSSVLSQEKQVSGWVETIRIYPGDLKIKAKLDTGALNSSLNAHRIEPFVRDGEKWVRFEVTNWKGRRQTYESKVVRMAKIKRHDAGSDKRPVIRLGICLGTTYKQVEVNLVDRSKFNYSMLLGRSYLAGAFIVDPSRTFALETKCTGLVK